MKEHKSGEWSPELTDAERATLFAIARDTLSWCVAGGRESFSFAGYTLTPRLKETFATFVTLKKRGMLRGCIGTLAPMDPLYVSIHKNAVSAALEDYRFRPVTAGELSGLEVHLSVLSPIRPIASLDEFTLGAHGIILEKGAARAVYLPEVAVEQKWTKEETLDSLSEKAGLPSDAWKQGARFKVFSSVVLLED
jgi:AmmeMemoRadiSam system protein A